MIMKESNMNKANVALRITKRNEFFEKGKKRINWAIFVSFILAALSFYFNWYTDKLERNNYYFSATEKGEFKKLVQQKVALHGDDYVISWASSAIRDVFDFSYLNYKNVLNRYSNVYFSDAGRSSLISALKESETIKLLVEKNMILSISVDESKAYIKNKGQDPVTGKFVWRVVVPAKITYTESEMLSYVNNVEVTLTVERRSLLEDNIGLAVSKLLIAIVK